MWFLGPGSLSWQIPHVVSGAWISKLADHPCGDRGLDLKAGRFPMCLLGPGSLNWQIIYVVTRAWISKLVDPLFGYWNQDYGARGENCLNVPSSML